MKIEYFGQRVGLSVALAALGLLFVGLAPAASAATWYVDLNKSGDGLTWPTAFATIGQGLSAANSGDEVWVATGVYPEALILKSGVTLYGGFENGATRLFDRDLKAHSVTIDGSTARGGSPAYHVIIIDGVTSARLDGFIVRGGVADGADTDKIGAGIYAKNANSTNTVAFCTIIGNAAPESYGGGIVCLNNTSLVIAYCSITGNTAFSGGGGIWCTQNSSPSITDCTITYNTATNSFGSYGGGLYCDNSGTNAPAVSRCTISDNSAASRGGGVCCMTSSPTFLQCTISGNSTANLGGGICCWSSSPTLTNCVISGNSSGQFGGALYLKNSGAMKITNCTVVDNQATSLGGGLFCAGNSTVEVKNVIFAANRNHAVYEVDLTCNLAVTYCLFYNNMDGDYFADGAATYTGASDINDNVSGAHDNVDGDPLFVMDGVDGITGSWTDAASYDPATKQTTLVNSVASYVEGALVGKLVNVDTAQHKQVVVVSSLGATIVVAGDVSGYAHMYDTYQVIDYRIRPSSPCIDVGTWEGAPNIDRLGVNRPQGVMVDIGAYEAPSAIDPDSDGDGIPNSVEGSGDPDNDGIPNYMDTDSDGDGIFDSVETAADRDDDGIPNYLDLDSDDDGISDLTETAADVDGDGAPNFLDPDSDNDGWLDSVEGAWDLDGDGIPNFIDNVELPYLTAQPVGATVDPGQPVTFSFGYLGSFPFTYQWHKDATNISTGTQPAYHISACNYGDAADYSCTVHNALGTATTNAVNLAVNGAPISFTTQPFAQHLYPDPGQTVTFSVQVSGGFGAPTYHWKFDNGSKTFVDVGTDLPALTIPNAGPANIGSYQCIVRDGSPFDYPSAVVALMVKDHLTIVSSPAGGDKFPQESHTFTVVTAGGYDPLDYTWKHNNNIIPGASGPSYTIPHLELTDAGVYQVQVVDDNGESQSSIPATLSVTQNVPVAGFPALGILLSVLALAGRRALRKRS